MSRAKARFEEKEVFPGDELAVIEEFMDGEGSYIEDDFVRSEEFGESRYDLEMRVVEVEKKTPELVLPKEGMEVVAETGSVARKDARVDIFMVDGRIVHPTYTGVIHISNVSREYIKNMDIAMRNGDIIKAKIINTKNHLIQLSMEGADYGVIYAYCSRCGTMLEKDKGRLHCPKCNRVERRQMARTYGMEELA
jgi:exosome complex component CSL4